MKKIFYSLALLIFLSNFINAQSVIDTIEVSDGWNLIGALNTGAIPDIIITEPAGIITSSVYGYTPGSGYQATDTLKRGNGYWVKVSQSGKIIFAPLWICTNDYFSETANIDSIVQALFGPNYRVADWNDMVDYSLNHSMEVWANNLGMIGQYPTSGFLVKSNGNRWWSGNRHYWAERHNHVVPPGWLVHGDIENHLIDLGSWYDLWLRILCVRIN